MHPKFHPLRPAGLAVFSLSALSLIVLIVLVVFLFTAQPIRAEQTIAAGAGALNTNARLNFRVVMPRFLRFRVGTANATINLISFAPTATQVGDNTSIIGAGGDAGGSVVNVGVWSNAGQIIITPTNNSAGLGLRGVAVADGALNYNQIITTPSSALLPAPTLSNTGGAATSVTPTLLPVTLQIATWAYSFANTTVPAASTFGTNARGGRVTYTASSP
jgi:hypothetical protein